MLLIRPLISPLMNMGAVNSRNFLVSGNRTLSSAITFTRATSATIVDAGGSALTEVGSGVPRFDSTFGLLIESQRTNLHLNSINGMTGSPVAPNLNASSSDIVAINPSLLVRKHTRDTGTADSNVGTGGSNYAITTGVTTTYSLWVYLPSSQSYGGSPTIRLTPDGHTQVSAVNADFSKRDQWQQINVVFTPTSTGTAGMVIRAASVNNGAFFYSCAPQVEIGSFPSQHIITSGSSLTRNVDSVSTPLSNVGIPSTGACTIIGSFMLPQTAPSSVAQIIMQISIDNNNRIAIRNTAGTTTATFMRQNAAAFAEISTPPTITVGVPIRFAFSVDGVGGASISFNGGAVQNITGCPTSLTGLRIGTADTDSAPLGGYVRLVSLIPRPVSDSFLQQFSAS